jgi:hypothetical protein
VKTMIIGVVASIGIASAMAMGSGGALIQWVGADVTRMAALLAWVAVAMLLAFVYQCARN